VIDLATVRPHRTTDVFAAVDHQFERFAGGAGEQATLVAEIDHGALGVDHDASHVPGERGADDVVTVDRYPVLGFAVLTQQILGQCWAGAADGVDQPVAGEFVFETFLGHDEVQGSRVGMRSRRVG
jgi:hypothetical protein